MCFFRELKIKEKNIYVELSKTHVIKKNLFNFLNSGVIMYLSKEINIFIYFVM